MKIEKVCDLIKDSGVWKVNKVKLVDGTLGVWKHAPKDSLYFHRSEFAYRISRFLGFHIVPMTQYTTYGEDVGVVQRFVANASDDAVPTDPKFNKAMIQPQMQKLALFDIVCNNFDRWRGNYLITNDSFVWANDNDDILRSIPVMSPTIVNLMDKWEREVRQLAEFIIDVQAEYLDFVTKEFLEKRTWQDKEDERIYEALRSQLGIIKKVYLKQK